MATPPADYVARPDDMPARKDALRFQFDNVNLPDVHGLSAAIGLIQSVGVEAIQGTCWRSAICSSNIRMRWA
ncbi:hypothetical protein CR51_41865 [Caballeronia megalochromosomata]|nr:hypothetical protein CR51_41865 [Caballeronia megalochromosomata]